MNQILNINSSKEQKRNSAEAVYEELTDYLFDRIILLNEAGLTTSTSITSTSNYGMALRIIDTSQGKSFRPDKKSRLRFNFYFNNNAANIDAYILSPAMYPALTPAPTNVSQLNAYVGVKVFDGNVSLVAKDSGGERTVTTSFTIPDDSTHILDILYNVTYAEIKIDGESLGSINCNLLEDLYDMQTFYPLIAPIRSQNGSAVQITSESYQFIQDK